MPPPNRVLVLSDGGLPSLVAAAAMGQRDGAQTAAVCPTLWEPAEAAPRFAATARQAELLGLRLIAPPTTRPTAPTAGLGVLQTSALVQAAFDGAAAGFATVLWPIHAGSGIEPDLDRVALAIDRALLVTRLVALDAAEHGCPSIRVDTPYADFTDRQIAELALDLDVPVHACWWWGGQSGAAAAERERWTAVLASCGWASG